MDFIKNKQKLIESANELINSYGEAKEIAKQVDDITFSYMYHLCNGNDVAGSYDGSIIYTMRAIRDFFNELETA